ncbi:hypothetical protein ACLOJK_032475 [Asimina triloba]
MDSKMPDIVDFFEDSDHGSSLPALMRMFRRSRRRHRSGAVPALLLRWSEQISRQTGADELLRVTTMAAVD